MSGSGENEFDSSEAEASPARTSTSDTVVPLDPWSVLKSTTAARIGLGRSGDAIPMKAVLDFQHAHALARDAVHAPLETAAIEDALKPLETIIVKSAAPDRPTYLRRPDLGRMLDENSAAQLEHIEKGADLLFVIGDGLSATAVQSHAVPLVKACMRKLDGLKIAPIVVATEARVALGDHIGEKLGARLCAMLIGERPGLSVADSLGVYLTFDPRRGRRDSERNCISNVHTHGGLTYDLAARKLVWLLQESLRRKVSGVALKDDLGAERVEGPTPG